MALADTKLADPIVALSMMPGRTASERLVAVVREAFAQANWRLSGLEAIAVVTGPGSFTGVRVGLSAAKGLSEAVGVPMVAISRLAILAAKASVTKQSVCALLDAGRSEYYCGRYLDGEIVNESLLAREQAIVAAKEADAVAVCEESVYKALEADLTMLMVAEPTAADALDLALKRLQERTYDDPLTLDANYLRQTDAEIFAKPGHAAVG